MKIQQGDIIQFVFLQQIINGTVKEIKGNTLIVTFELLGKTKEMKLNKSSVIRVKKKC